MAWRRGTQNQQAGAIRKGHVKEFLVPSSKALAASDEQCALKILCAEAIDACDAGAGCAAFRAASPLASLSAWTPPARLDA